MYCSALSRVVPDRDRRCRSTSSTLGCRLPSPLSPGGSAVQITESRFLACAHSLSLGISGGESCPFDQLPMLSFVVPSRRFSCFIATSRQSLSTRVHSDRTGRASGEMTNVIRSSLDCRANSTGISGPSSDQDCFTGKLRGFQIREPQPRHAIFCFITTMLVSPTGRTRHVWREFPRSGVGQPLLSLPGSPPSSRASGFDSK